MKAIPGTRQPNNKGRFGKRFLVVIFIVLSAVSAHAQTTAMEIETLLDIPAITYAQAARFVLEAADIAVIANPDEAFQYAADRKWLSNKTMPGDRAKLNEVSLLLIESFKLNGGLFYSVAKTPHYAYRELVYKQIILGRTDPEMDVSGEDFLYMVSRILSIKEADEQNQLIADGSEATHTDFFIGPLAEIIGFSRNGASFGGGFALGAGNGVAIGLRFFYGVDTESIHTMEIAVFMRFYLLGANASTGPFAQINVGASTHNHEHNAFPPVNVGAFSAGIAAGWRFLLAERWYLEPSLRLGYPYIVGGGVSFAYRL